LKEHLTISTATDLLRLGAEDIIFITSDGNYSTFMLAYGNSHVVTMQLGQIEKLIKQQLEYEGAKYIRIGKSLIINSDYIQYINIPKQQLILSDGKMNSYSQTASKEALRQLKDLIDKTIK
jgi:DNA-binding LytR/AlgR family response regulator